MASPWPPGILQSFYFPFLPWELPQKSGVCEDLAHSGLAQVLPQRPPAPQGRRGRVVTRRGHSEAPKTLHLNPETASREGIVKGR
jgi:hypothetical protein